MLKVQALGKSYGKQNVLINFNLEVQNGEIISLLGSSGSGKTTFLRLVAGLEIPDSGQIILNEKFVNDKNTFVRPERRDCSLVFQDYALFPNMSVHENIFFHLRLFYILMYFSPHHKLSNLSLITKKE